MYIFGPFLWKCIGYKDMGLFFYTLIFTTGIVSFLCQTAVLINLYLFCILREGKMMSLFYLFIILLFMLPVTSPEVWIWIPII